MEMVGVEGEVAADEGMAFTTLRGLYNAFLSRTGEARLRFLLKGVSLHA